MARSKGDVMISSSTTAEDLVLANRIGTGLARLIRLIDRASAGRADGLDRPSFMLLHTLVCLGPSRVTTLAGAVHSDPSTVSRQAAHLVALDLVERRADPDDGRASLLAITAAGTTLLESARKRRDERIAAIVESWPCDEQVQFAELLDRFATGYEAHWCPPRPSSSRA